MLTEDQIIAATVGERRPLNSTIYLAPYDPAWPSLFTRLAKQIHEALGDAILLLEHVGSTSVPGLSAQPIIDMVLAVADSSDESSHVKPLEEKGYTLGGPAAQTPKQVVSPTRGLSAKTKTWSPRCTDW